MDRRVSAALLMSTAFAGFATGAGAQTRDSGRGANGLLGEVVVTATRQSENLNRAPLSITAVTQAGLDAQGARNVLDLSRITPALNFRRTGNDGATNVAIRGIYSTVGAPTTGVYLDDVPLQKRFAAGATPGNGNPYPMLFDLDRVEVLRGPQGTLFGGSSEGGTVRFITPTPDLIHYGAYARAEVSNVKLGGMSHELGLAVGGPIVEGRLAFRVAAHINEVGGWIDHVDIFSGAVTNKDSNEEHHRSIRAALLWKPTERLTSQLAVYAGQSNVNDLDSQWADVPAYSVPARGYDAAGRPTANPALVKFVKPAASYPALTQYGRGTVGNDNASPRTQALDVYSLTTDYRIDGFTARWVASYIHDQNKGMIDQYLSEPLSAYGFFGGYIAGLPRYRSTYLNTNKRHGITQELRLTSDPDRRLTWVAGVFYSKFDTHALSALPADLDALIRGTRGVPSEVYYGVPPTNPENANTREQFISERELAGFGEANFRVTDRLKLTAGLRISRNETEFRVVTTGQIPGYNVPTLENGGLSLGSGKETPATPKVSASYAIDDDALVYLTAAKGYRPGGVNNTVPKVACAAGLAALGGRTPDTYGSDSLWSYEGGAKFKLFDRIQLNGSAFYVDWKDIQFNATIGGCPVTFTTNAGKATARGGDLQASARLGAGFSLNLGVGYTDVHFSRKVLGPPRPNGLAPVVLANKGDSLPIPPWTMNLGLQYDRSVGRFDLYARADHQFTSRYHRSVSAGASGYTPDSYAAEATNTTNLRLGVAWDRIDLSAFVNNLFDTDDRILEQTGRTGCTNAACASFNTRNYLNIYNTLRPRSVGLTATYRY
jgi:outer membrane receptor protein involved in Fe transport